MTEPRADRRDADARSSTAHEALGAKIVEFGGWLMPIQYAGILEEHRAVRDGAGPVRPVAHGRARRRGAGGGAALAAALVSDPPALAVGRAQYSMICAAGRRDHRRPDRLPPRRGPVPGRRQRRRTRRSCPTSSRRGCDGFKAVLDDRSLATGLVAVQGPRASTSSAPLTDVDLGALRYYGDRRGRGRRDPALRSPGPATPARTGSRCSSTWPGPASCGTRCSRPGGRTGWSRSGSAPATRSASRPGCRSTATSSTGRPTRTRPASGGSSSSDKPGDFVGRAALEKVAERRPRRRLVGLVAARPGRSPATATRCSTTASATGRRHRGTHVADAGRGRSRWPTSRRPMPNRVRCWRSRSAGAGRRPRSCRCRSTRRPA